MKFNSLQSPNDVFKEIFELMSPLSDMMATKLLLVSNKGNNLTEYQYLNLHNKSKGMILLISSILISTEICKIEDDRERDIMINLLRVTCATITALTEKEDMILVQ